jgi:hypothetical protein
MSCLFHSLGKLLDLPTDTTRQLICDYLLTGQPIIDGMTTQELLALECPDYIDHMRHSQTLGGAIEIQAAVNLWNVRVIVENHRDPNNPPPVEFVPLSSTVSPRTTLRLYWTGGHFEPIQKKIT